MTTDGPSRRHFLGVLSAGAVALAGCTSGGDSSPGDDTNSDDGPEQRDESPEWPPVLGDPEAEITLEVFEDFNCPHCQDYSTEQFPDVRSEYLDPELIRYEHRDLPIPVHESSWGAASAAREVYRLYGNEAFWAYKSELMSRGAGLSQNAPDIFGDIADQQNLDADAIQEAAESRAHDDSVRADRSRAVEYGVEATPGFVVDGEVVDGLAAAREAIDSKLSE